MLSFAGGVTLGWNIPISLLVYIDVFFFCPACRDAKRYCYRNTATGALVWNYPGEEEKKQPNQDSVQDEVEMELSDTPPRLSPHELDAGKFRMQWRI